MTQKVICSDCGKILYDHKDLKAPMDVIKKYEAICPQCGKKLVFDSNKVEIKSK